MARKGKSYRGLWIGLAAFLALALAAGLALYLKTEAGKPAAAPATAAALEPAPEKIRIGSYNMAMFGTSKTAKPSTMAALGRVGACFDIMAMQEVGSNGSTASEETCAAVMESYLAAVDAAAGGQYYDYVRSDQYAFIYRKDRLEVESSGPYSGKAAFTYRPLVASFRVKGRSLDFVAITIHTRPGLAKTEIPALAEAMEELASSTGEPDVLCLGDFNADGSYYDEGRGSGLAGFPEERYATLIGNSMDTTVAKGQETYDRIEASAAMSGDWDGSSGVLKPGELWDLSACEGGKENSGGERALSDHYPVWAEFFTTLDRD